MTLHYLATPFSRRPSLQTAYREACEQAAFLMREGIDVFSPIAHSYGIALHGDLDQLDHDWWMARYRAHMERCDGMILCRLPGWDKSVGIAMEWAWFQNQGKPVIHMGPWVVPERLLRRVDVTACKCGKPVEIEHGANTCRADGKRVYHPEDRDTGWCLFRCKGCGQPVHECVSGAEYAAGATG